jgi:hypothetical protein
MSVIDAGPVGAGFVSVNFKIFPVHPGQAGLREGV